MLRKKAVILISLLAMVLVLQGTALASSVTIPIAITNPSFEADNPPPVPGGPSWYFYPGIASCTWGPNSISNWNTSTLDSGVSIPIVPGPEYDSLPTGNGTNSAWSMGSILSQTLNGSYLQAGDYTLKVWVGNRKDFGFDGSSYTVALYAGGTKLTAISDTHPTASNGEWVLDTLTYHVASNIPANQQLQIQLFGGSSSSQVNFDNASLDFVSSVPLPASVLLLGSGLAGLMIFRRKRIVS
jgi:hypothetical protein